MAESAQAPEYENNFECRVQSSAFRGKDLVDWIQSSVPDLVERFNATQYAAGLLQGGYITTTRRESRGLIFDETESYIVGKSCSQGQPIAIV